MFIKGEVSPNLNLNFWTFWTFIWIISFRPLSEYEKFTNFFLTMKYIKHEVNMYKVNTCIYNNGLGE